MGILDGVVETRLGARVRHGSALGTFTSILDFTRFHSQISISSLKLLKCQRAQLDKVPVPADSIVETLNVIKHI